MSTLNVFRLDTDDRLPWTISPGFDERSPFVRTVPTLSLPDFFVVKRPSRWLDMFVLEVPLSTSRMLDMLVVATPSLPSRMLDMFVNETPSLPSRKLDMFIREASSLLFALLWAGTKVLRIPSVFSCKLPVSG
jgi:hypothetical protein